MTKSVQLKHIHFFVSVNEKPLKNYKFIENTIRYTLGVQRVFISIVRAIIWSKHLLKYHYYDYHYYYHCYNNSNNNNHTHLFEILSFSRHQN